VSLFTNTKTLVSNMKTQFVYSFVIAGLLTLTGSVNAKERIVEFTGNKSTITAEFEATGPWILDWRVKGDYPDSLALQVNLESSPRGEHLAKVVTTKWISDGVRLFNESGKFRFKVDSSLAEWTLIVEQLNRLEADMYTPRGVE